ncbi:hypothetical protein DLM77_07605 [Leptospira yasudae]|uniref:Lipoprotein n=1 Tax=Leptospira yasudae TaxID=2202201 RepID=A0ABX9M6X5_9LEPT|nr:hypothetical protein DLM77_07605 [Leptospira yasudae]
MKTLVKFKIVIFVLSLIFVIASCNLEDEIVEDAEMCGFEFYTLLANCTDEATFSTGKAGACLLIVNDYEKNCK